MFLNSWADFILSSFSTQLSKKEPGKISDLPDIKDNRFVIKNISFG